MNKLNITEDIASIKYQKEFYNNLISLTETHTFNIKQYKKSRKFIDDDIKRRKLINNNRIMAITCYDRVDEVKNAYIQANKNLDTLKNKFEALYKANNIKKLKTK